MLLVFFSDALQSNVHRSWTRHESDLLCIELRVTAIDQCHADKQCRKRKNSFCLQQKNEGKSLGFTWSECLSPMNYGSERNEPTIPFDREEREREKGKRKATESIWCVCTRERERIFDAVAVSLRIENVEREKNECAARHFISADVPYRASSCMVKNRTRPLFAQAQRWTKRW